MDDLDDNAVAAYVTDIDDLHQVISLGHWSWAVGTRTVVGSRQFYAILGFESACPTPTLRNILACVRPEDRRLTFAKLRSAFAAKEACEHEFGLIRPDGGEEDMLAKADPGCRR